MVTRAQDLVGCCYQNGCESWCALNLSQIMGIFEGTDGQADDTGFDCEYGVYLDECPTLPSGVAYRGVTFAFGQKDCLPDILRGEDNSPQSIS